MLLRLLLAALCVAVWAAVGASSAGAQAAADDSVTGTVAVTEQECRDLGGGFIQCFTPDRYTFDAHSGAAGQAPSGTVTFATGERLGLQLDPGSVSCLKATGDRASIGVNFEGFLSEPHAAVIYVEDLGGEGQDKIAVEDLPAGATAPSLCPAVRPPGLPLQPTYPVNFADWHITVIDTPAVPATTMQCTNGGWQAFGIFKNQGECVSFVRHQARQECIFIRAAHGRPAFRVWYGSMRGCVQQRISD